jgi:heptosyltransferase I
MKAERAPAILIVKLSSLGDLFHALPAIRVLKQSLGARIDWVVQPEYTALLGCFDDVEQIIPFPRRDLTHLPDFLSRLRSRHYDIVIDLQGLMKSALITAAAKGKNKIGPSASREGARLFYRKTAGKRNKQRHAAGELLDVVRHLGLPVPQELSFPVSFPPHPGFGPGPHIALCPCSRAAGKNWPADRFAVAAKQLQKERTARIHLIGGPSDRTVCAGIAAAIGPAVLNHAGQTSLVELGSLLQQMDLLITVDSGPMHMAAAIGTPTLALFGPTSPLRTGPFGARHRVIESTLRPGKKRISKKTRQNDLRYIEAIPAGDVIRAALEMLPPEQSAVNLDSTAGSG